VAQVLEIWRKSVFNQLKKDVLKMKAPRIVQSYCSKAYQNTPNSGWAFRESHYMSWALSCLQLKQFYDEIELVTDSEGADLLIRDHGVGSSDHFSN
jgi:hypothetical protein